MKKYLLFIAIASLLIAACGESSSKQESSSDSIQPTVSEDVVKVAIKDFDSLAGSLVGKKVQVSGLVNHLCKHGGKKMFLTADSCNVHVVGEERFNDTLVGSEVSLVGLVKEFKLDEGYCAEMDEKNQKALSEGKKTKEEFEHSKEHVQGYRDSMKTTGTDHLSFYSIEFVEFK